MTERVVFTVKTEEQLVEMLFSIEYAINFFKGELMAKNFLKRK